MKHVEHRPLRFALVGVGRIGTSHLEALSQVEGAALEAVVDPRRAAAEAVAEQKRVRWFEDFENAELLDAIDAVIICTPPNLHYEIARHFLTSGKHVLCEKPLGVSVEEVEGLRPLVERSGKVLQVGHMKRFDPALEVADGVDIPSLPKGRSKNGTMSWLVGGAPVGSAKG